VPEAEIETELPDPGTSPGEQASELEPEFIVPADFPELVGASVSDLGHGMDEPAEPHPEEPDTDLLDPADPDSDEPDGPSAPWWAPSETSQLASPDDLEVFDPELPEPDSEAPSEPEESLPEPLLPAERPTADQVAAMDRAESAFRDRVKDLTAQRDFKGLARLIEGLVDPANEGFNPETAQRLAEEFTTPAVASSIVAHLASSRDEGERARLGRIVARVGREGPPAVADALEQARDRSERRALVGAMVALGPRGFDLACRMVEDPRWYVVRNGVSVMGEVGGEEAVTHLTATLASEDGRVRKATVLALAKLGGSDTEMLILGMLDDPEPSVRAVACRALGVLGLQRAVRPLMVLMKDPDPEVQIEAIQALGLIGDPGPVQQIERKALGGFLAKPQAPIRIAAFRALAAIGTPRALKTLQKGALDSDEEVKASVRALLRS
jgi:HEAT repeat protein